MLSSQIHKPLSRSLSILFGGGTRNRLPSDGLVAAFLVSDDLEDSIGLSVDDYDDIGVTWQAIFFTNPTTPVEFEDYDALWAAVSAVGSFNDENVMGTEAKGVAVYSTSATRVVLNKALRWFGLPIVGGWVDLEHFSDGEHFTY